MYYLYIHCSYDIYIPDINECAEDIDDCEHDCINTEGGYYCMCDDGYLSVGSNCSGMYIVCIPCSCDTFQSDIDECVEDIDDCEHNCINTEGGYNCTCDDGYISVGSNCSGISAHIHCKRIVMIYSNQISMNVLKTLMTVSIIA